MFEWKIFSIFAEKTISLSRYASLQSEIEARPFKQSNAKDRQYASVSSRRSVNKHKLQKAWILKTIAMNILKTTFAFFFALCFMMGANCYAQKTESIDAEASKREFKRNAVYIPPTLEEYADTTLLHQRFNVENKGNYLYTPFTEDNEPSIPFNYGFLHPLGERFYNCFMGKVDRILRPKEDKGFIILTNYLVVLDDKYAFDTSNKDTSKLADFKYLDFRHIKSDFSYGHPYQGFTDYDRVELSNFVQILWQTSCIRNRQCLGNG